MNYQDLLRIANENLFIIGEVGVNHNGKIDLAIELIDKTIESGCDAVKFQTWITDKVYSKKSSIKPDYHLTEKNTDVSEYELIKSLELSFEDFLVIKNYCDSKNILFFSTPDEIESANFLTSLKVDLFKIASQDVTNTPFLDYVSRLDKVIILSSGACTLSELTSAVEIISKNTEKLIILHCLSAYPAPINELNLNFIKILRTLYKFEIGFSDHTLGSEAACVAVGLGARFFEKHITLDKSMEGPDHKASLNPVEMKLYCDTLRSAYKSLGNGIKKIQDSEMNIRKAFSRYVVASKDIQKGKKIEFSDISFIKCGAGISPKFTELVIGSEAVSNIKEGEIINWNLIKLMHA